jgi:hypothetical protein
MPAQRRHAKRKTATAERKLIEFLQDPAAGDMFFPPADAPQAWGTILTRDLDNPRSATSLNDTARLELDAHGKLTTYAPNGLEHYTNAEGVPCGRTRWKRVAE